MTTSCLRSQMPGLSWKEVEVRYRYSDRYRYRSRRNSSSRVVLGVCSLMLATLTGALVGGFRPAHSHPEVVIITATATENQSAPALSPTHLRILRSAGFARTHAT